MEKQYIATLKTLLKSEHKLITKDYFLGYINALKDSETITENEKLALWLQFERKIK